MKSLPSPQWLLPFQQPGQQVGALVQEQAGGFSRGLGVRPGMVTRGPGVVKDEGHRLIGVGAERQRRKVIAEQQEAESPAYPSPPSWAPPLERRSLQ